MAAKKPPAKRKPPAKKPAAKEEENQGLVEPISARTCAIILELLDAAPIRGSQARDVLLVRAELIEKSEKPVKKNGRS